MSDWNAVAQMLGLKQQRDEARRNRFAKPFGDIASMVYGSRQAGKQRDFIAGESEAERLARMTEIGERGDIAATAATELYGREKGLAKTAYLRDVGMAETATDAATAAARKAQGYALEQERLAQTGRLDIGEQGTRGAIRIDTA
ncbi:hypothetical protein LCGC14_2338540, partial [marine sediment metagenome]